MGEKPDQKEAAGLRRIAEEASKRPYPGTPEYMAMRDAQNKLDALVTAPRVLSLLDALQAAEQERDEAIKDRNAHAEHVRRMASECEDGLAALEEIDRCWEACGYPTNRSVVTLEEQIRSMACQIDEPDPDAAEARALAAERQLGEVAGHLRFAVTLLRPWAGGTAQVEAMEAALAYLPLCGVGGEAK